MTITLFGTSNCIVRDSFVPHMQLALGEKVLNLSIGASTSSIGLYMHEYSNLCAGDVAVLDYVTNDTGYLAADLKTPGDIKLQLASLVYRIRSSGADPLLIIMPSEAGLRQACQGELTHLEFCTENSVPFINLSSNFRHAIAKGIPRGKLLRDPSHMASVITPMAGRLIAKCIQNLRATPRSRRLIAAQYRDFRRLKAESLSGVATLKRHASSLHEATFAVLRENEQLNVQVRDDELLAGILLNTGALGADVMFETANGSVTKPMTIYWDPSNPSWFTAILVEFKTYLSASEGGINMIVLPKGEPATEVTMHSRPSLGDRYGEIEFAGFLIVGRDIKNELSNVSTLDGELDLVLPDMLEGFLNEISEI